MKEFNHVIADPQGVHARPAGDLVKIAKTFECAIGIHFDGKSGDCKKIFTVMALGVKPGHEVTITVEGEDEAAAAEAMESFFKANL